MASHFDPVDDMPRVNTGFRPFGGSTLECSGGVKAKAIDYHHATSASLAADGTLVVALRNLNAVAAFDLSGGANAGAGNGRARLRWLLSPTLTARSARAGARADRHLPPSGRARR